MSGAGLLLGDMCADAPTTTIDGEGCLGVSYGSQLSCYHLGNDGLSTAVAELPDSIFESSFWVARNLFRKSVHCRSLASLEALFS